jgi:predicted alpha/beta hydrolase family esterase
MTREATVLIAPGLRDHVPEHWQTLLASRLPRYERVSALARAWGSRLVDLGEVGHLNPASGFGDWPQADAFINELDAAGADCAPEQCLETTPFRLPRAC